MIYAIPALISSFHVSDLCKGAAGFSSQPGCA